MVGVVGGTSHAVRRGRASGGFQRSVPGWAAHPVPGRGGVRRLPAAGPGVGGTSRAGRRGGSGGFQRPVPGWAAHPVPCGGGVRRLPAAGPGVGGTSRAVRRGGPAASSGRSRGGRHIPCRAEGGSGGFQRPVPGWAAHPVPCGRGGPAASSGWSRGGRHIPCRAEGGSGGFQRSVPWWAAHPHGKGGGPAASSGRSRGGRHISCRAEGGVRRLPAAGPGVGGTSRAVRRGGSGGFQRPVPGWAAHPSRAEGRSGGFQRPVPGWAAHPVPCGRGGPAASSGRSRGGRHIPCRAEGGVRRLPAAGPGVGGTSRARRRGVRGPGRLVASGIALHVRCLPQLSGACPGLWTPAPCLGTLGPGFGGSLTPYRTLVPRSGGGQLLSQMVDLRLPCGRSRLTAHCRTLVPRFGQSAQVTRVAV